MKQLLLLPPKDQITPDIVGSAKICPRICSMSKSSQSCLLDTLSVMQFCFSLVVTVQSVKCQTYTPANAPVIRLLQLWLGRLAHELR